MVMANLRKRVAACDLTRTRPTPEDPNANEAEQEQLDNRPLLPKVCCKRLTQNYSCFHYRYYRTFLVSSRNIHGCVSISL